MPIRSSTPVAYIVTSWAVQALSPLKNKTYRPIWLGGIASNLGGMIHTTAAAWYMLSLTDSPFMVALVQSAAALPLMLFALLAGALADLYDRRLQMIVALTFCTIVSAILFALTAMDTVSPLVLLFLTFLIGVGTAFYAPAWQSSVLEIVPPEELSAAISLNSLNYNIARSVGPSIGAEILTLVGVAGAFFSSAISYLGLIAGLVIWKKPRVERKLPRERLGRAMIDGLRFVALSPTVRKIMLRGFLYSFGAASLMSLPPVIAQDIGHGPRALGALLGGFGIGAMIGALLSARIREDVTAEHIEVGTTGIIALLMVGLAFSPWLWISVPIMMVAGACWVLAASTLNVALQTSCPRWVSGRTLSIFMMTFSFGIAAGAALSGFVAGIYSYSVALLLSAAFLATTLLFARFLPIDESQIESVQPLSREMRRRTPQIDPRAGPVVVTADYRVPAANAKTFMSAMYAMARVRRRDGARRWSLTQDVDDPELWIERFHSPTWADYLHRVSRKLTGDDDVYQQVSKLCRTEAVYHRRLERPAGSEPLP